jgi:hypothetical protein
MCSGKEVLSALHSAMFPHLYVIAASNEKCQYKIDNYEKEDIHNHRAVFYVCRPRRIPLILRIREIKKGVYGTNERSELVHITV